jgi:uncharacterized protein
VEEYVRAYARLRLKMAREEVQPARDHMARGHYRAAVSRAYYAVFYMASAALFTASVTRAKHSGVESAFSEYLIKPGHIEVEYGRLYQKARRQREEADYAEDTVIDEATTGQIIADAERFVDRLERYLEQVGALDARLI